MKRLVRPLLLIALCCTGGCNGTDHGTGDGTGNTALEEVENDPRWHPFVRDIVEGYGSWMRLDDALRWAPQLCSIPLVPGRVSAAEDGTPHGRKLYTLYVKDPAAYGAKPTAELWTAQAPSLEELAGLEQVIVKEAWKPAQLPDEGSPPQASPFDKPFAPVQREGHWYAPGEPAGLFIMLRPEAPEAPTDEGWVYAAVAADGTIRGAGRMATCMACHHKRPDRLFGVPPTD